MLVDLKLSDLILIANLLEEDAIEYEELALDPDHSRSVLLKRAKDRRETKLLITKVIDEDQRKKEIELGLV